MNKDNLTEMNNDFVKLVASDIAVELIELNKHHKTSPRYHSNVFEILKNHEKPTFYLSERIDAYIQEEATVKRQEKYYSYVLFIENHPVCIVSTHIQNEEPVRWDYNLYPVNEDRFFKLIDTEKYYLLNAKDYGLYVVGEDDYYILSNPIEENKDFMNQVKKLGIVPNKIHKDVLDPEYIQGVDFKVHIKDYPIDTFDENKIPTIRNLIQEEVDLSDYELVGPILSYQYYFTSLNEIEVVDFNMENESYLFKVMKDHQLNSYVSYDSFDDEISMSERLLGDNAIGINSDAYFVNLANVGFVFEDHIVDEEDDHVSYSSLDQLVTKEIQKKLKNEKPTFKTYK